MLQYLLSVMLLFVSFLLLAGLSATAEEIDASVESNINISTENATSFSLDLTVDVSFITLPANELKYTDADIGQSSPERLGAIKYVYELPKYESGVFLDKYNVQLQSSFFSMNASASSTDVINGLLDSGVFVNYSFPWTAQIGWNNTYALILSDELGYKRTDGSVDNKRISWDVLNGVGNRDQQVGTVTLKDMNPTTDPSKNESVSLVFSLDCKMPKNPKCLFCYRHTDWI